MADGIGEDPEHVARLEPGRPRGDHRLVGAIEVGHLHVEVNLLRVVRVRPLWPDVARATVTFQGRLGQTTITRGELDVAVAARCGAPSLPGCSTPSSLGLDSPTS